MLEKNICWYSCQWKAKISPIQLLHLNCHDIHTDIADTSVKQSEERYNEMRNRASNDRYHSKIYSAEFITADLTKVCGHSFLLKQNLLIIKANVWH